jgi:hypothetical protein
VETYSPVMNAITFRFFIGLVFLETLDMHLVDVVTIYLYGSLDKHIHIKISKGFKMLKAFYDKLEVFIPLNYKNFYMS